MVRALTISTRAVSLGLAVVVLSACAVSERLQPVADLMGTWRPVELLGEDYSDFRPQNGDVVVVFEGPDAWSANNGCNIVSGRLQASSNGDFHAETVNQTDVGCDLAPHEVLPNVRVLERATAWRLEGEVLVLDGEGGAVIGVFRR